MRPDADPPVDRADLLERIIAEGDRRRRRRVLGAGGMAVVVLAAGLAVAWPGADDPERLDVASQDHGTTTTAAKALDTSSTSTSSTAVTGATDAPGTTTATTTEPEAEDEPTCRNSYDPRCGDFYWDYDPATFPNAPMTISLAHPGVEYPQPGTPVTFEITFEDPDMYGASNCASASFTGSTSADGVDDPSVLLPCGRPACVLDREPFGPWDPPPPPATREGPVTYEVIRIYPANGVYTVSISGRTESFCGDFPGYESERDLNTTVVVGPPTGPLG